VRTTTLAYERSVFTRAARSPASPPIAADGAALPAWHLTYTDAPDTPTNTHLPGAPALDPTADGRAWVDIDGDALPDLLDATPGAWRYRKGLGTDLSNTWTNIPAPAVSISKSARFADLTGDGVQDILAQPGEGELWAYTGGATPFAVAAPVSLDLSFDLSAPNVALVDMNLDGRVDILRHDEADGWLWLRDYDAPGYEPRTPSRRPLRACAWATPMSSSPTWTATASPTSCASCPATAACSSPPTRASASSPSPPT
jgi:hypothetical protein